MTTALTIVNHNNNSVAQIELDHILLEGSKGEQAVHDSIVAYLAARRTGTASTKNRASVRGGGAKPWRQKGTGRARAGSNRSPLWRGGGIIFGPTPRNFSKKINKKVYRLAIRRAFTDKVKAAEIIVVDVLDLDLHKTKEMFGFLKQFDAHENTLIIREHNKKDNVFLATRNLASVRLIPITQMNVYLLCRYSRLLFSKKAIDLFAKQFAEKVS